MICLGKEERSVIFEITPKYCISDSLVDYEGYSISSKGLVPIAVDLMVIWIKFSLVPVRFALIPKMSIFTLAISYLTTSNLPWFMDLIFQVPMQYCSLQHWTLLSPPVPSTTGRHSCFGSASSFLLELFICCSPVAYWAPANLGSSSFSILSFCLFIWFMGFSSKHTEVICHSLLQWITFGQNSPPWPVCLGWPYTAWFLVSLS